MTPYTQLYSHEPSLGVIGDCWRTAIGCLLDLPPDSVPHFLKEHWLGDSADAFAVSASTKAWLADFGLTYVEHAFTCSLDDVLDMQRAINPDAYYLLSGSSPRGFNHCVIAKSGAIIHDPYPGGGNLVGPAKDGYYWVAYLVHV